jgi:hypothetical protein
MNTFKGHLNRVWQTKVSAAAGLHVNDSNALATSRLDVSRFPMTQQLGEYQSANYETAANRVNMVLDAVGSAVEIAAEG